MADYTQITDFSAKDGLSTGDPEKLILGSDVDGEFSAIATAISSKYDSTDIASQAEAEAETVNTKLMTPLRIAQWADANGGIIGDLQALAAPAGDRILGYDLSGTAAIGFTAGSGIVFNATAIDVDHDAATNFVADEHVAHGGVTLTAGSGLTGGGTIAASRTFNVGAGTGITVNADDVALSAASQASLALADSALQSVVSVASITDVTISAIASGELLKWNGSAWINNTLAEAGISATGHTHVEADITDLQNYLVNISEDATPSLGGSLAAGGNDINNVDYLHFDERASAPTVAAGHGAIYVDDSAPSSAKFKDDEGVIYPFANVQYKTKTGDEVIANNTIQDDDHLTGFDVEPNSTYAIEGFIFVDDTGNGDIKMTFTYTVAVAGRAYNVEIVDVNGSRDEDHDSTGGDLILAAHTNSVAAGIHITGMVRFGAVSSGTGKLRWAQNSTSASGLTFKQGSWMTFTKVA
jgi:hypothetical protein